MIINVLTPILDNLVSVTNLTASVSGGFIRTLIRMACGSLPALLIPAVCAN